MLKQIWVCPSLCKHIVSEVCLSQSFITLCVVSKISIMRHNNAESDRRSQHVHAVLPIQREQLPEHVPACFRVPRPGSDPLQPAWKKTPISPPAAPAVTALPQLQTPSGCAGTAVPQFTGAVAERTATLPPQPSKQLQNASALRHGAAAVHCTGGFGLPPIPGHSFPVNKSPDESRRLAARARIVASPGQKHSGPKAGKNAIPSACGRFFPSRVKKESPGWNSDFSVQYQDPVSIKDQERVIKHMTQGRSKQRSTPSAIRAKQPSAAGSSSVTEGKDGWPELKNFIQPPCTAQKLHGSSHSQPVSAACQRSAAMPRTNMIGDEDCGRLLLEKDDKRQLAGWAGKPERLPGGRPACMRNLDSAQSPLRPYKSKDTAGRDSQGLHKQNGFCFLPFQVWAA